MLPPRTCVVSARASVRVARVLLAWGRRSIHSAAESIRLGYAGWATPAAGLRLAGPRGGVLDAAVGVSAAKLDKLKAGPVANHGLLI
jgi:hypothetical protein